MRSKYIQKASAVERQTNHLLRQRDRLDDEEPQIDNDGSSDKVMVSSSHTDINTDSELTDSELGDMQEVMDYDYGSSSESQ